MDQKVPYSAINDFEKLYPELAAEFQQFKKNNTNCSLLK
jgi:hypothetical protein